MGIKAETFRVFVIIFLSIFFINSLGVAQQRYEPTKESLVNCEVPEWYLDAKFGIWPHWGVYSVPAYRGDHDAAWYGIWMYCVEKEPETIKLSAKKRWNDYYDLLSLKTAAHHRRTYGDPSEFGYHDFVPMWKAEKWDPDAWAQMAVDAGAKFFCMMGMHHDGFALYDSDLTRWNSVDAGPKRNLCDELAKAVRKRGLRFGVSNHFAWNYAFFKYYHNNGFAKGHEEYADFYSHGIVDEAYMKRWWDRTIELADKCKPDLYYFDWGWHGQPWIDGRYHEKFASFFYNRGIEWGRGTYGRPEVVLNSKFNKMSSYCVRDLERSKMAKIQSRVWQTDTSISVHCWGYSKGDDEFYSLDHLIGTLMDIISKNGVLMLNFGPKADGTVPEGYYQRLMGMGKWLKINGEAVYATRPYVIYGEGPAPKAAHETHKIKPYDGTSVRFTRNKDNNVLYATALQWPGKILTIRSLAEGKFETNRIQSMRLLGTAQPLSWTQDGQGLKITMPKEPGYGLAYPVRIQFTDQIPIVK